MIFSTSSIVGFSNYNDSYFFIKRHLIFIILGMGAFIFGLVCPYQVYQKRLGLICIVTVALLLLTLSPLGIKVGGAQRWIDLGLLRFQPVELAKFCVLIFVANGLIRKQHILNSFAKGVGPLLMGVGAILSLLILQPDLGNIALILLVTFCCLFLSTVPVKHLIMLISISTMGIVGVILSHPYQLRRISAFLNPWADPLGKNYHTIQSFIAIGSGGLTGVGLGESKLKYFYLPLQYSDFIYSIICEEGGFILAFVVILLYVAIMIRTYQIVSKSSDNFAFILGMGCCLFVCLQAFINIAVVIGLLPVTGIPLTFISFGGTSLITSLFYIGVILNISNSIILKDYKLK